jgi:predicted Zn-dependent protease
MPRAHRGLLCLGVAIALGGCAINPVTQRREVVFVSEEQEVEAGAEAAEQVAGEMGIVDDARLTGYVAAVGRRVVAQAPESALTYRFAIVDLDEPNAFALPGGYVYVSRGLLAIANSEDELANVIAHEVVHVAGRHHAQRHARVAGVGLLALPGLLAGALIGGPVGDVVSAPFAVAGAGALAGYSRDQELEADEFGQQMAAKAGYDPEALGDFLLTLEQDTKLRSEETHVPSWFDTHPSTPRRASDASRRAAGIAFTTVPPIAPGGEGFLRRLDGLLVGDNAAEGVFQGQRFLHPDLDFTLVFPDGWETINTRRAVGAVIRKEQAQVALEHQGSGNDPREAASVFLEEASQQGRIDVARMDYLKVGRLDAVRGQVVAADRRGTLTLDLTWIALRGSIYRIAGVVPRGYSDAHRETFGKVVQSFRPLSAGERQGIREQRLRLRTARAGETVASFVERTGSAWGPRETSVANGLSAGAALPEESLLKVAIPQPYRGQ